MPTEPRQPQGPSGVVYIDSQNHAGGSSGPSEFLASFGGKKDGIGAFSLGRASGFDSLTALLRKLGVSPSDVDTALQVLMVQPHHEIPNVILTQALIRELGL
jgi:hypothetical protein